MNLEEILFPLKDHSFSKLYVRGAANSTLHEFSMSSVLEKLYLLLSANKNDVQHKLPFYLLEKNYFACLVSALCAY